MKSKEIRQLFLDYYTELGYKKLPKAPMLDPSIPMSFVMSAGLVQVEASLAREERTNGDKYVLVQDCFRHFDLDKVGTDDIHLSMFEMPGAFVFGTNQKDKTVRKMWTLATTILGIDKKNLWATYFEGGKVMGNCLPRDSITHQTWVDVGLPENRIIELDASYNFWIQKGTISVEDLKKCGPNTELFYDRGESWACGENCKPGCICNRFIEFSNSLFISYEIDSNTNKLNLLTNPFTETVIGIERVAMILEKSRSVFEIEDNKPVLSKMDLYLTKSKQPQEQVEIHKKVILDHLKALYILVSDGAPPPGKDGRARIIKMLIRRVATRLMVLEIDLGDFLPVILADISQTVSKEVKSEKIGLVMKYFLSEYKRFTQTIKCGERKIFQLLKDNDGCPLSTNQICYLEKQMGIPPDITNKIIQDQGILFGSKKQFANRPIAQLNEIVVVGG